MKLASKGVCALMFTAAVVAGRAEQSSASPMHFFAVPSPGLVAPVACKYGKGKCPNVKPGFNAPSTKKNGLPDPTVDPDCKYYGSCDNGGPIGTPADIAAKKGTTTKPTKPIKIGGVKGESQDTTPKSRIQIESVKSGGTPSGSSSSGGHSKGR